MRAIVGLLLLTCCFSLGVMVEPRLAYTQVYARHDKAPVHVILGEARRLFVGYFFTKADVYFHNGYYPSIFDEPMQESHMATETGAVEGKNEAKPDFMGTPRDWIDRFSRSFYPSRHVHLDAAGKSHQCDGEHHEHEDHDHAKHTESESGSELREILPWLTIASKLDPNRIETYTVGAYWLRTRMRKPKEAELFLREGLRQNPGSYAVLFELGRVYRDAYNDSTRARNVWELALKRWNEQESSKPAPDTFLLSQITWQLALVAKEHGERQKAISYLEIAKRVSPHPESVQKTIEEIQAAL